MSMSFSVIAGVWSIYVDDFETPVATGNIGPALSQVLTVYSGKLIGMVLCTFKARILLITE
jgi:hypothetical protein